MCGRDARENHCDGEGSNDGSSVRLDQTYHDYHFPAERLAFSVEKAKIIECVLINFSSLSFWAERLSFSAEAKDIMAAMTLGGRKAMMEALCVLIKHIIVIISRLRGWPLVWSRQKFLGVS